MKLHITKELTEKDVVSRIMRKENYLVGMLNKVGPWLTNIASGISDSTHLPYQCAPLLSWSLRDLVTSLMSMHCTTGKGTGRLIWPLTSAQPSTMRRDLM